MNVLSLFSGIGGLELGLERAGMTTVGQVEIDPFCRRVLAKHWPEVPRHDDVRTAVDWWRGGPRPAADVVCGGFPCQDISNAGRREGIAGARSGLWAHMRDTVRALRPRYVVMENVAAILVRGLDVVAADLAEIGYDLRWDCVPASAVGAPHQRDRWWGIAYPQRGQLRLQSVAEPGSCGAAVAGADGTTERMADTGGLRRGEGPREFGRLGAEERGEGTPVADADALGWRGRAGLFGSAGWGEPAYSGWWSPEPDVGRVAHGIPQRVDRLRSLGNAVVPQVAEHIGRLIVEAEARAAA